MLRTTFSFLSLKANLFISMLLVILPLLLSAIIGYFLISHTVIADFQDVSQRQQNQMDPVQNLQLKIWRADYSLEEYLVTGNLQNLNYYRNLFQEIEGDFTRLSLQFENDNDMAALILQAQQNWRAIEPMATELALLQSEQEDADSLNEAIIRFDGVQESILAELNAIHDLIEEKLTADYLDAAQGYERSKWITGIAAGISVLFMISGVMLFTHNILKSVDKLVEGADRFAKGDRDHTIDVQVPRELHKVAEEFNRMIKVIHRSEEKLADQARTDQLTGLLNRRAFDEAMDEIYDRLRRKNELASLISLDIDHFKSINDKYGHDAGDAVLKTVSRILRESVRSIDKVFRCGGEEFSIILPGADLAAAGMIAERIRSTVEDSNTLIEKNELRVTVSLGCALAASSENSSPELLQKQADTALYQAKNSGRNRVVIPSG